MMSPEDELQRKRDEKARKKAEEKQARLENVPTLVNLTKFIATDETYKHITFDSFCQRIFLDEAEWTDAHTLELTRHLEQAGFKVRDHQVYKAAMLYAHGNQKNTLQEILNGLEWDQVQRGERLFIDYFGAEDSEYTKAASRNFLISGAARGLRPGCKVDTMPVLEGPQGSGKSQALRALGTINQKVFYAEIHESAGSKDFALALQGVLLAEIAELDSFSYAEANCIKKVISCQVDRFRPPYGRCAQDFPRQCVLVGTTNDSQYLRDSTGGRRFWPIRCGRIDLKAIARDRDQLWAEAVSAFKAGASWWEMPAEATAAEQEERRACDPWEAVIVKWLVGRTECTTQDILVDCVVVGRDRQTRRDEMRVAAIMNSLGWTQSRPRIGGTKTRIWRKHA